MTQAEALTILKTGANVFLTGEPGAGKTHTINAYVSYLCDHGVEVAITASTGIAATHIGGMTIHSWSGIGIRKRLSAEDLDTIASREYVSKRIRRAKVLVIDEVSMLSPETLSMVDAVCREVKQKSEAFGGLQVVFVGDFFQLPPVADKEFGRDAQDADLFVDIDPEATPARFACDSRSWKEAKVLTCYLTEQYRQDDTDFLSVLSAIRRNAFTSEHLAHLQKRKIVPTKAPTNAPKLFSHNLNVDQVNDATLSKISDTMQSFQMTSVGHEVLVSILKKGCLSPELLQLKIGAEVMCTKNSQKDGFVNGTLGTVVRFEAGSGYPVIQTRGGRKVTIEPLEWTLEENGKIKAQIRQVPLRLAWAITVHKSQGMSLDEAVMDLSQVFEYGQGYVALSRVRRLSGLYLLGWNERAFQVHPEILGKDELFQAQSEEAVKAFSKIPEGELAKMHRNFLLASGGVIDTNTRVPGEKAKKPDTKMITLGFWKEGKTTSEIAKARNLKDQTIFDHIEKLVAIGEITKEELRRLVSATLAKDLPTIHGLFKKLETHALTPLFEQFGQKYSYDELRLARMLLDDGFDF
ncbi:MAG: hypothetical protein RLZZ347_661 [Candidatus Parcubacteria bacterium]|jgi:DNA-binding MarR family transcriptional regulator